MSGILWKYYLQDDLVEFRHLLESSGGDGHPYSNKSGTVPITSNEKASYGKVGQSGDSPTISPKSSRLAYVEYGSNVESMHSIYDYKISKHVINSRDNNGTTILHRVSSSSSVSAIEYARALLQNISTDIYVQDWENGWTCLHRAFYFGNISIARLILERDWSNSKIDTTVAKSVIRIKDKEGNAPFDVYTLSIQNFPLTVHLLEDDPRSNEPEEELQDSSEDDDYDALLKRSQKPITTCVNGTEVLTFGSNRNVTLGFGDEDDRQFPERIIIRRPDHLVRRFHREQLGRIDKTWESLNLLENLKAARSIIRKNNSNVAPTTIRNSPIVIQDVQMSKLHTAVLTTDPESNLYVCGHGLGGRLGTGDEATQFKLKCLEGGSLAKKKVIAVALGLNHSLALTSEGELSSWGSNAYGQLGYALAKSKYDEDVPVQYVPRQIYGPLKREVINGIAASRIHSVAFTNTTLFSFGKNEGQLGIVDADARSLQYQIIPRRVAVSLFKCPIRSVTAIEKATVCLLENNEVWVFANFGYARLRFLVESISDSLSEKTFRHVEPSHFTNVVCKVTAGGDSICALTNLGEIYAVTISQRNESLQGVSASTTNPSKIRGAFSAPTRVWTARKAHMAAKDVSLDQDGSIILTTEAGTVWRRERRSSTANSKSMSNTDQRQHDYKFLRVPGLNRVAAVRSSAHGAYAAVRKGCNIIQREIKVGGDLLRDELWPLLSLRCWEDQLDRNNRSQSQSELLRLLKHKVLELEGAGVDFTSIFSGIGEVATAEYDVVVCTSVCKLKVPVHGFMLASRSPILRKIVKNGQRKGSFSMSGLLDFKQVAKGKATLKFHAMDIITVLNFVIYIYCDAVLDVWNFARLYPQMAPRYRLVRIELMKIAQRLELLNLEPAVRQMLQPKSSVNLDMELAIRDPGFFEDSNVLLQFASGEQRAHVDLLCQRCPFFHAMFRGRAGGIWLADRRDSSVIKIDMTHVDVDVFHYVLRYLYADAGDEMFEDIVGDDFDDMLDLDNLFDIVLDVMAVANELMLDRLSQICQRIIGRFVNDHNICQLLNAVAPCSVTDFKDAALEYLCRNLEGMLTSRMLDEIDEPLLQELDAVVRASQLACMPVVRSGRAESLLYDKYPQLADMINQEKQGLIKTAMLDWKANNLSQLGSLPTRPKTSNLAGLGLLGRTAQGVDKEGNGEVIAVSPPKRETSTAEPMFSMDDICSETVKNSFLNYHQPATDSTSHGEGHMIWPLSDVQSLEPFKDNHTAFTHSLGSTLEGSPRSKPNGSPWGSIATGSKGTGMRDIMAEDSRRGTSSIFAGSPSRHSLERRVQGSFSTKISQKARKKLQAEQLSKALDNREDTLLTEISNPKSIRENPWQSSTITKVAAATGEVAFQGERLAKVSNNVGRSISGSQLTMRQTVAHNGPALEAKEASPIQKPEQSRAVSSPATPKQDSSISQMTPSAASTASLSPLTSRSLPKPQIQSIRHTPMPARIASDFDANYAISDILSQQQAEKEAIRDAAAKRSLQEIQMEQEFQEWWDQESKKIMEEQQAAVARPSGRQQEKGRGQGNRRKLDVKVKKDTGEHSGQGRSRGRGEGGERGGRGGKKYRDGGGGSKSSTGTATPITAPAGRENNERNVTHGPRKNQ